MTSIELSMWMMLYRKWLMSQTFAPFSSLQSIKIGIDIHYVNNPLICRKRGVWDPSQSYHPGLNKGGSYHHTLWSNPRNTSQGYIQHPTLPLLVLWGRGIQLRSGIWKEISPCSRGMGSSCGYDTPRRRKASTGKCGKSN